MSMVEEFAFFLGFKVWQCYNDIFSFQEKYARNMIKKICTEKSHPNCTPAASHAKISKDSSSARVDESL